MTDVAQIIADIEAWLDKATPGEWTIEPHGDGQVLYSGRGPTRHGLNLVYLREGDWNWHTNANYIVSVGPDRIRALLDEVKRLRELFRLDGEQHAAHIKGLTEAHEKRVAKYVDAVTEQRARAEAAETELAKLRHDHAHCVQSYNVQVENLKASRDAAEAELARLREPAGDVRDDLYKLLYPDVGDGGQTRLLADRLIEFFKARLRSPAGEVGEVVTELNRYEWAHPILKTAAELLTRQAAYLTLTRESLASAMDDNFKTERERDAAEARLREAGEIVAMFDTRIKARGEWDDGCFYHNGTSASELQEPLTRARAFLAKLETNHE